MTPDGLSNPTEQPLETNDGGISSTLVIDTEHANSSDVVTPNNEVAPVTLNEITVGEFPESVLGTGSEVEHDQTNNLNDTVEQPPTTLTASSGAENLSDQSFSFTFSAETETSTNESGDTLSTEADMPSENDHVPSTDRTRGISQRNLEDLPTALDWEEVSSEASDAINNVVENIVDRMRIERMFELRRIQFGDRAVSRGETAQRLEELLSGEAQPSASGTDRPHRSDVVRDELEELSRNQSVGNLLNTRFRTLLESSLSVPHQGGGRGIRPATSQTVSTSAAASTPSIATTRSVSAPLARASRAPDARAPRAPPGPFNRDPDAQHVSDSTPALPYQEETISPMQEEEDATRQAAVPEGDQYQPPDFSERQFDYAITDVEELFQRRLVSDVLHSAFRNVLELHIERRLVRSGRRRGSTVQPSQQQQQQHHQPSQQHQQQQNQPSQQQQQQQPSQQQQQYPRTSVNPFRPSQPAPINPPSSSRRLPEIERQIHSMSTEMKDMKTMLKLLVDTQLDIQRSIRQEVNALMKHSTVTPAPPTPLLKDGTCVVCLESSCDTVLYRCGHLCCCFNCARSLRVAGHHCPVCRAEVTDILRIYKSTNE